MMRLSSLPYDLTHKSEQEKDYFGQCERESEKKIVAALNSAQRLHFCADNHFPTHPPYFLM